MPRDTSPTPPEIVLDRMLLHLLNLLYCLKVIKMQSGSPTITGVPTITHRNLVTDHIHSDLQSKLL